MIIKGRDGIFAEISTWEIIKVGFWIWVGGMMAASIYHSFLWCLNAVAAFFQTTVII